jgi:hypothetical protein
MYVHHCVYLGASDRCRDAIHRVLPIDAHPRSAGRDDKPSEKNAPEWCRDAIHRVRLPMPIPAACEGGRDEARLYNDPIPAACEGGRDESRPYNDPIPAVCEGGRDEAHPYTDPIPAACEGGRDESRPYTLHRKHCLFLYCTLSLSS